MIEMDGRHRRVAVGARPRVRCGCSVGDAVNANQLSVIRGLLIVALCFSGGKSGFPEGGHLMRQEQYSSVASKWGHSADLGRPPDWKTTSPTYLLWIALLQLPAE